jgi:hypothetical protein
VKKKIIIGIHGLGNKPDQNTLSDWWRISILEGLNKKEKSQPQFDFELVYWAHLLHSASLSTAISDKNDPLYIEDPYAPAINNGNNEKAGSIRKKVIDLIGDQLEHIFLNKDLTINFSSVNDFVIRHFFKDLAVYYNTHHDQQQTTDLQKKTEIRAELAETLRRHRKRQILLIAHSMGAIIAYDVLMQLPEIKVDTFITIGCPLGLPIIRSKIAAEHFKSDDHRSHLQTPEAVTGFWYNFADLRDKIALYYRLADDFKPNSRGIQVQDQVVINDYRYGSEKNPHKSYGYLRTSEIAAVIDSFLTRKPAGFLNRLRTSVLKLFSLHKHAN